MVVKSWKSFCFVTIQTVSRAFWKLKLHGMFRWISKGLLVKTVVMILLVKIMESFLLVKIDFVFTSKIDSVFTSKFCIFLLLVKNSVVSLLVKIMPIFHYFAIQGYKDWL